MTDYIHYLARLESDAPDFAAELRGFDGVDQVAEWASHRGVRRGEFEMISHDEFSYDVVIRLRSEDRWIVFGVN